MIRKKLSLLLLLVSSAFYTLSAQAPLVIASGQTYNVNSFTVENAPGGVLVESGGTLNFVGFCTMRIGAGKKIVVESGGKITGVFCTMMSMDPNDTWTGIETLPGVPGEDPAVTLNFGRIQDAFLGIYVKGSSSGHSRKLMLTNTTFQDNEIHTYMNCVSLDDVNGSRFERCRFLDATDGQWGGTFPVEIDDGNDIQFNNCVFDFDSEINLHLHWMRNIRITGCEFNYNVMGVSLHFDMEDVTVSNCTFKENDGFYSFFEDYTTALELGKTGLGGGLGIAFNQVRAANNTFYPKEESYGVGIAARQGGINRMYISQNTFKAETSSGAPVSEGFGWGIQVEGASGTPSYINGNTIEACFYGLSTGNGFSTGANNTLRVQCNIFKENNYHWVNTSAISQQTYNGYDPNNKFIGGGVDIDNLSGSLFAYYILNGVSTIYTPDNSNNISIGITPRRVLCKTKPTDGDGNGDPSPDPDVEIGLQGQGEGNNMASSRIDRYTLFPNPVKSQLNIKSDLDQSVVSISIINITGQQIEIEQPNLDGSVISINVGDLPAGTYWCHLLLDSGDNVAKQFTIQR